VNPRRITEEQKNIAVEQYAKTGVQKAAADAAGVTSRTLRNEMKRSATFKEAMEEAKQAYHAYLHSILRQRIKEGTSKMSDALLMFEMKKQMPEYRERFEHKVEGNIKIISGIPRPK